MDAFSRRRQMMSQGGQALTPVFYDRLIFDGDSVIETDISLPEGCSIRVTLRDETKKTAQGVFSCGSSTNGYSARLYYGGSTNTTKRNMAMCYDSKSYIANRDLNFSNSSYAFFMTPYGYGWGNDFYTYTKGTDHSSDGVLFLAPASSNQRFTGKMQTFYVYGSDASGNQSSNFSNYTPVITLRPCTYNGQAGMWYVEGSKFFGKTAGDGTLTVENAS